MPANHLRSDVNGQMVGGIAWRMGWMGNRVARVYRWGRGLMGKLVTGFNALSTARGHLRTILKGELGNGGKWVREDGKWVNG